MSAGESETSQEHEPRKLGLDRLSAEGIEMLGRFISQEVERLREPYERELHETFLELPPEQRQTTIQELATSEAPPLTAEVRAGLGGRVRSG